MKRPAKQIKIIIFLVFFAAISVATLVRMYTLDVNISLVSTLEPPELPTISDISPGDYRQIAVSLDASGYSETTTSTAEDLSIIAAELLENPVLKEIVGLKTYSVPVAGVLTNTNQILGTCLENGVIVSGVKTGYIGSVSGYNLISSYEMDGHFVTQALLGASTRQASFTESENNLRRLSRELTPTTLVDSGAPVGYLETWWNGRHALTTTGEIKVLAVKGPDRPIVTDLTESTLAITVNEDAYSTPVVYEDFSRAPTFIERFLHLFGWRAD